MIEPTTTMNGDAGVLRAGAVATVAAIAATLVDIAVGSATGADLGALPRTAPERFAELLRAPLLGLYHLDLLNALVQVVTVPAYVALLLAHPRHRRGLAALATGLFLASTALFLSTNAALPMLQLARDHAVAGSETLRSAYAAAGEAWLARGAHGSLGAFPAFALTAVAGGVMSLAMLLGGVFPRAAGWAGLLGNLLLLAYLVTVTFVPGAGSQAMALAMPGGLLALGWMVGMAVGLWRRARAAPADG